MAAAVGLGLGLDERGGEWLHDWRLGCLRDTSRLGTSQFTLGCLFLLYSTRQLFETEDKGKCLQMTAVGEVWLSCVTTTRQPGHFVRLSGWGPVMKSVENYIANMTPRLLLLNPAPSCLLPVLQAWHSSRSVRCPYMSSMNSGPSSSTFLSKVAVRAREGNRAS